jgi:hypothetical protein
MPITDAELNNLGTTLAGRLGFMSLHSADPGTTGANEVTGGGYARQACTFTVDADGDLNLDGTETFAGPAAQGVTHVGFWSAASGGTFRAGFALTGDAAFSAGGVYEVTDGNINGTST